MLTPFVTILKHDAFGVDIFSVTSTFTVQAFLSKWNLKLLEVTKVFFKVLPPLIKRGNEFK